MFKDNLLTANQSLSLFNSEETVLQRLSKSLPEQKMFVLSANRIKSSTLEILQISFIYTEQTIWDLK